MNRLECLRKSSTGSQKQPAKGVTSAHAKTHKPKDKMGEKTVTNKPRRSHPVRTLPCPVQVSCQETQRAGSSRGDKLNTEACAPKGFANIKPRAEEQAEQTTAPDEELKMKELRNTQPSDSAEIGGTTHAPPPVERLPTDGVSEEDEQTDDEDAEDEDLKAPVELILKFLRAVMDRDFQLALKLCQMVLIYEPNNPEASEFLPLIQKKLQEEQEESSEEDDEEEDDRDDDDDDDDDDDASGSDEESSQSSGCSSSSYPSSSPSDQDEEEEETKVNRHKLCPPSHISP